MYVIVACDDAKLSLCINEMYVFICYWQFSIFNSANGYQTSVSYY